MKETAAPTIDVTCRAATGNAEEMGGLNEKNVQAQYRPRLTTQHAKKPELASAPFDAALSCTPMLSAPRKTLTKIVDVPSNTPFYLRKRSR